MLSGGAITDNRHGLVHVAGQLPDGVEPFETKVRIKFYDEADGRTRLEIRRWLPKHPTGNAEQGWLEALAKLEVTPIGSQTRPSSVEV
ncbi:hypothetical protein [Nocardia sienata]|uniref:hypothetical protein n=1 Tax=Nocardia sienata TaxID=248552 RepID=UPI0007A40B0C|nr:hypothetical protein [Nocardia sienata]